MWTPLKNDDGTTTDLKNSRIDELIDLLDEVEGKVIIWANYIHDIEALVKAVYLKNMEMKLLYNIMVQHHLMTELKLSNLFRTLNQK